MVYSFEEISEVNGRILSQLAPYWGGKFDENQKQFGGALSEESVFVEGLPDNNMQTLSRLLKHTEIRISNHPEKKLNISIKTKENTMAPVTLKTDMATFHLKPLRKDSKDVQTWIHKRIWLPVKEPSYTILFHSREEKNISEWIFYMIVQFYLSPAFDNLAKIAFSEYKKITLTCLNEINRDLTQCQLSLAKMPSRNWPRVPPNLNLLNENQIQNRIQPFHSRSSQKNGKKINPFSRKQNSSTNKTIDPFNNQ